VRENGGQYSHGASWLVDAWLACAALARDAGHDAAAAHAQRRARDLWWKISPLTKVTPAERDRYGLPPHQQPADVYEGPGYEGRGGWSWYTGAAARMLWAAYALVGIELAGGVVRVRPGAAIAARSIALRDREIGAQHSG
jgi:cyclic beta-1,2-glucan synthetase